MKEKKKGDTIGFLNPVTITDGVASITSKSFEVIEVTKYGYIIGGYMGPVKTPVLITGYVSK